DSPGKAGGRKLKRRPPEPEGIAADDLSLNEGCSSLKKRRAARRDFHVRGRRIPPGWRLFKAGAGERERR
ncbi:MAG: hypothetical protein K6U74_16135, partial [Firmicutes bacterium]|nr:hypothetical protein [Bacillota bacterium]